MPEVSPKDSHALCSSCTKTGVAVALEAVALVVPSMEAIVAAAVVSRAMLLPRYALRSAQTQ